MSAQEDNGFKKFSVEEAFEDNGFQWFRDAQLLCAGSKEKSNAMTIGWGGIGTLWRKTALTVYVAEKRYTKEYQLRLVFQDLRCLLLNPIVTHIEQPYDMTFFI